METIVCHGHTLTPSSSGFAFRCYWCKTGDYISNGYHCFECDRWFHKDCGDRWFHKDCRDSLCRVCLILHTSHPEHFLKKVDIIRRITYLFILSRSIRTPWEIFLCSLCKRPIDDSWYYQCSIGDDFYLHNSCAIEPPPLTTKHPHAHKHPLVLFLDSRKPEHLCEACKENIVAKLAYRCFPCEVVLHVECVHSSEVNHPCHPKHSIKLLTSGAPDYTDNTCLLCGLKLEGVLYHCSICNFSVCLGCTSIPPPIDFEHFKTHEHKLTLMARQISFTCNACGIQGNRSPYFCLKCDFMVHRSCISLPRVININRHDHRISHTQQLSSGDWVCKVCFKSVNRFYGAYISSVSSNYVVHTKCATKIDVWDGIELEGVPEETEDIRAFKEVEDNLINHMSHEKHNLKLNKDGTTHGESIRCEACMHPIYSDRVYSCEQCSFVLHEICAKLPRKKLHMFHSKPFTLNFRKHIADTTASACSACSACGELFNGFRYESDNVVLDVRCILIPELFSLEKHEHPNLHYNKTFTGKCDACHRDVESGAISCLSCDYNLDFRCASLPKTVKHVCDQHPLSLYCKENASGKYWCEICEEELDPNRWLYTCNECEVSLHVMCVLGDFSRLKPQKLLLNRAKLFHVIPNNHSSRPICLICKLRCEAPFILKTLRNRFICSKRCFYMF